MENPSEATAQRPRTYGCAKCGTPFTTYPPDDLHHMSSRHGESFLDRIETSHVCSNCSDVTRLYWGRPVFYRDIVLIVRRLYSLTTLIAKRLLRIRITKKQDAGGAEAAQDSEISEEYSDSPEDIDDKIYEYILSKGGAIGIRGASEDLGVPAEVVKEAIQRMTMEGRLKA